MNDVVLARAIHVLAVLIWIGGVSMVTTVALSAVRRGELGADLGAAFEAIERRFVWQARTAVILAGSSGLYMTWRRDLWDRFRSPHFWWMHAMVGVWLIFALVLFVVEPLVLRHRFAEAVSRRPQIAFAWLHRLHWGLLVPSLVTVFGAVAGSHGWSAF
jgi:uncharacterized membrane protein